MRQSFAIKINVIAKNLWDSKEIESTIEKLEKWEGLGNVGGEKKKNTLMLQQGGVSQCTRIAPPHIGRKWAETWTVGITNAWGMGV